MCISGALCLIPLLIFLNTSAKMHSMKQNYLSLLLCCITTCALAHAPKPPVKQKHPSPWDNSNAQVGYIVNRGNTDSSMFNLGGNVQFTKPRWQNQFQGQFQYGIAEHVTNRQYTHLYDQIQYDLNNDGKHDNYIFANADATLTRYGPYTYQTVYAAGYGRDWITTKHFTLSAQIGPGYRRNKEHSSNRVRDAFVATTQANAALKLGCCGTITQTVRYDIAKPYNYMQAVTAFTNKIVGHVAIQTSYTLTHYSNIPSNNPNTKKTDSITNLSLVYNF